MYLPSSSIIYILGLVSKLLIMYVIILSAPFEQQTNALLKLKLSSIYPITYKVQNDFFVKDSSQGGLRCLSVTRGGGLWQASKKSSI